jgi:hypothetical protein
MNKKMREVLNGIGMVAAAVAMMAVAITLIFLVHIAFHPNFRYHF